ncbi:hypothetical protein LJR290_006467 [Variovorax sp. LjRoot290]
MAAHYPNNGPATQGGDRPRWCGWGDRFCCAALAAAALAGFALLVWYVRQMPALH